MAFVTIAEAAKLTSRARQSIYRDIKAGKVSATIRESDSAQVIDTAELIRAYGPLSPRQSPESVTVTSGDSPATPGDTVLANYQTEIAVLRAQLEAERARAALAQSRIEELKQETQDSKGERDRLLSIIENQTRLLEHKQAEPTPEKSRSWLPWKR